VPERAAEAYLRALSTRIRLADGISVQDRFDLVIFRDGGSAELLYAGLDRVAASDVQLMRWAVDGRVEWVDATGTEAQAEAMRMPVSGRVTSRFGMRFHPILHSSRFHRGIDLKAIAGTPIKASADGRVVFAGWSGGYGRQVRIGHGDGLATSYSHMSRIAAAPGAFVRRGEVIGYVGSSGLSTGPHLHYEVFKNGHRVDPAAARSIGGGQDALDKQERTALNARLRALLTAGRRG
jgi:murein DD-endopeptidase MepM/ murein hydrolase activator NlpD